MSSISTSKNLTPIGPVGGKIVESLANLPPIILGGGIFNYQYHERPDDLQCSNILKRCFELGIRAIDTSAYYGPSEGILGEGLEAIKDVYPRDSYYLCTKAGRDYEKGFDYSKEWIRESVIRSCQRLKTSYLDVVYLHDIEFVPTSGIIEALTELFKLKNSGVIRHVGITGYPVKLLVQVAQLVKDNKAISNGEPLDIVLSYSNLCLQNTTLKSYISGFEDAGIKCILNASPLSMSLLRSGTVHDFHPADEKLKKTAADAAKYTASEGVELASLATRFAYREWEPRPTVFGLSSVEEVEQAVDEFWASKDSKTSLKDGKLVQHVQHIFGETLNSVWESGIPHEDLN
ncbi:Aldo/keto reductase [Nadsonia fulvescens var. elongata DSM 6958]|uniref:Aldo/keto reductase n=1 Tax=Nadsonia fulvescens var. elongata DSM 6958 TaxID=857566 RepID=A0A1E3PH73_9ASCO|nr:Aldo/keto reductase [Nadsonia fulvescens var. elongata DSM 6958]